MLKESGSALMNRMEDIALMEKGFGGKKFRLERIMVGSQDGFTAQKFHQKCDGVPNTISLFESNHGLLFGGYTSIPWSSPPSKPKLFQDPSAWLFSVSHYSILPF